MAERAQKKKANPERVKDEAQVETKVEPKGEKLIAELDDLLDEIDEVLESNAEDFVKSYVQKGGE
ncbi:MAG: ubiquitin-like protein Pup [Actinomycetota bacterium]|nr:ubiquitin-like protein Pup [Actinomycetota bacterium]